MDLVCGLTEEASFTLSDRFLTDFVSLSGDDAPLHTDPIYARDHGFQDVVVHGAGIYALISNFVSNSIPGPCYLWLSSSIKYHKPVYLGQTIRIIGVVKQISQALGTVSLGISIYTDDNSMVCSAKTVHQKLSHSALQ